MEFKVKQDNYNALLKRKELLVEVEHEESGTPSRMDLRKAIAAKYGAKPDIVYVVGVETKTGTQSAMCEIQIYDDPETAKRIVPQHMQVRNLPPDERRRMKEQRAKKEEAKIKPEKPKEEKTKVEKAKQEAKAPAETPKKGKEDDVK